jgi:hypothetical protein
LIPLDGGFWSLLHLIAASATVCISQASASTQLRSDLARHPTMLWRSKAASNYTHYSTTRTIWQVVLPSLPPVSSTGTRV